MPDDRPKLVRSMFVSDPDYRQSVEMEEGHSVGEA